MCCLALEICSAIDPGTGFPLGTDSDPDEPFAPDQYFHEDYSINCELRGPKIQFLLFLCAKITMYY